MLQLQQCDRNSNVRLGDVVKQWEYAVCADQVANADALVDLASTASDAKAMASGDVDDDGHGVSFVKVTTALVKGGLEVCCGHETTRNGVCHAACRCVLQRGDDPNTATRAWQQRYTDPFIVEMCSLGDTAMLLSKEGDVRAC